MISENSLIKTYAVSLVMVVFLFFLPLQIYPESANSLRNSLVATAQKYLGVPYAYGASSPAAFDCSGFVSYVYKEAVGITLPRSSVLLWQLGTSIPVHSVQPGDILVFDTRGGKPSHVALVLDTKRVIHAVSQGPRTGVIISAINDSYFGPRIIGARSFLVQNDFTKTNKPPTTGSTSASSAKEVPMDMVACVITKEAQIFTDKIPAQTGSALQFAVTNETGTDGFFEILFFKMDLDPAKARTIRQDRIQLSSNKTIVLDPIMLSEPGHYKLIIKTASNLKRVERVWKVVAENNR
ncbi:MAG: C40 family peptidase [Termitinemataceae bacterium]